MHKGVGPRLSEWPGLEADIDAPVEIKLRFLTLVKQRALETPLLETTPFVHPQPCLLVQITNACLEQGVGLETRIGLFSSVENAWADCFRECDFWGAILSRAAVPQLTRRAWHVNITNVAAVLVVILVFCVGARYCLKFLQGKISPRIATWLIFEIGVAMSLVSYLAGHDHSLTKAALNVADCLQVTVIVLVLLFGRGRQRLDFTSKERLSLWISGIALIVWVLTRVSWVGFLGFQTVMSVAYLPTLESLWRWKPGPPPEPLDKWGVNVLITLIGLVVDLTGKRDYLAMIYPLRALILCLVVVGLILRWQQQTSASVRMPA